MKKAIQYSFICLFLTLALPTFAQTNDSSSTPQQEETIAPLTPEDLKGPVFPMEHLIEETKHDDHFFVEMLKMFASLGLIIALILIVAWFLKRMVNTRIEQSNSKSPIKILDRRNLSPKSILYLLEVEGTGIVIAESATGVTKLTEFPLVSGESPENPNPDKFRSLLDKK